jgi:hypothetical protein
MVLKQVNTHFDEVMQLDARAHTHANESQRVERRVRETKRNIQACRWRGGEVERWRGGEVCRQKYECKMVEGCSRARATLHIEAMAYMDEYTLSLCMDEYTLSLKCVSRRSTTQHAAHSLHTRRAYELTDIHGTNRPTRASTSCCCRLTRAKLASLTSWSCPSSMVAICSTCANCSSHSWMGCKCGQGCIGSSASSAARAASARLPQVRPGLHRLVCLKCGQGCIGSSACVENQV